MKVKHFECEKKHCNEINPDSKKKEFSFFKEIIESVKKTARIIAIATAASVTVMSCHTSKKARSDAEDIGIQDSYVEEDIPDVFDIPDIIEEDIIEDEIDEPEAEISCVEGVPLDGEVPHLISNYGEESVHFNGPTGESIEGTAEITIGGEVDTSELLVIGECPDEVNAIAAFGAYETSFAVAPSWRLDVMDANAEMPEMDADFCPPPEDYIAISMFNDSVNITVIPALIGSVEGRIETGFSNVLSAYIYDGDTEVSSPILLDGGDNAVKSISVVSAESMLGLDSKIRSNTGEELSSTILEENIPPKTSKILKISQLDSDDTILPNIENWVFQGLSGPEGNVYICLRPCSSTIAPKDEIAEINAIDITPVIVDSCGKIFAAFDIPFVGAEFNASGYPPTGIEPFHLTEDYSIVAGHYGEGLDALSDSHPKIYINLRRDPVTGMDTGERVELNVLVNAIIQSRDENPATGEMDTRSISFNIGLIVPSLGDYDDICSCMPTLP